MNIRSNTGIHKGGFTASPAGDPPLQRIATVLRLQREGDTPRQRTFLAAMSALDWIAGKLETEVPAAAPAIFAYFELSRADPARREHRFYV